MDNSKAVQSLGQALDRIGDAIAEISKAMEVLLGEQTNSKAPGIRRGNGCSKSSET